MSRCARWSAHCLKPRPGQLLLRVQRLRRLPHRPASARRRGRRSPSPADRIPGHQIVGTVVERQRRQPHRTARASACRGSAGPAASALLPQRAREPLRARALHRPRHRRRACAEFTVADERFCFPLPDGYGDLRGRAAAVRRADRLPRAAPVPATAQRVGLYGFGAAAHILTQVAAREGRRVFAFTRARRRARRRRSRASSAPSGPAAPRSARRSELDARDHLRPRRTRWCRRRSRRWLAAERVVCGGIHMSRHPVLPLRACCGRSASLRSVANLTTSRRTGVPRARRRACRCRPASPTTRSSDADEALEDLRAGRFTGAAVIVL